ncbi:isochorismatase family protein [Spiroplasma taiwanense]|uniref:nicotinamidase n=1 Tax=Spiroplasma taiwanense CT-1 TaxID=1276220 RepID=S5LZ62_9MOLU|nr:isochorismatase family protein [Spiroplasma taiwanense]AGR40992.1 pyrazinamidase/nicotinamidase [Spiroplasma taiwanense CT-1]
MKKALIVVDYQYDFADPKGTLYVPNGETLKKGIQKKIIEYKNNNNFVIFSGDFHPKNHVSFKVWPEHCLIDSKGCSFYIDSSKADLIIKKGSEKNYDSYSAFYIAKDLNIESELDSFLKRNNIKEIEICGLALDVCVKDTYEDAKNKKYNVKVNLDLSKSIDQNFILEN